MVDWTIAPGGDDQTALPWADTGNSFDHFTGWGIRDTKVSMQDDAYEFLKRAGPQTDIVMRPSHMRTSMETFGHALLEDEFHYGGPRYGAPVLSHKYAHRGDEAGLAQTEYRQATLEKDMADIRHNIPRYVHKSMRFDDRHVMEAIADNADAKAQQDHSDHFRLVEDHVRKQEEANRAFWMSRDQSKKGRSPKVVLQLPGEYSAVTRLGAERLTIPSKQKPETGRLYAFAAQAIMEKPEVFALMFAKSPIAASKLKGLLQDISKRPDANITTREKVLIQYFAKQKLHLKVELPKDQAALEASMKKNQREFIKRYRDANDKVSYLYDKIPEEHRDIVRAAVFELVRRDRHVDQTTVTNMHERLNVVTRELKPILSAKSGKLTTKERSQMAMHYNVAEPTIMNIIGTLKPALLDHGRKDYVSEYMMRDIDMTKRVGKEKFITPRPSVRHQAVSIGFQVDHGNVDPLVRTMVTTPAAGMPVVGTSIAKDRHAQYVRVGPHALPGQVEL